jgi:hypothetical protein
VNDDELLAKLKTASAKDPARARAPRWERLASGEADDAERRALEAIARADGDDEAMTALAPSTDAERARALETVERARKAATVVPIARRRRAGAIASAGAAIAIAAGVALWVVSRGPTASEPLPSFALTVGGADQTMRSGAPAPAASVTRLGPGAELRIRLRPESDVTGPLDVRLAIVDARGPLRWNAPYRVSPSGVVEIAGPVSSLIEGPNGRREIAVAVGRPGSVPESATDIVNAPASGRFFVYRATLEITGRP